MNRRRFLGLLAPLLVSISNPSYAANLFLCADNPKEPDFKSPQFILLGDTNHADLAIPEFMSHEETMASLHRQGVKKLFIERPQDIQPLIDDLAAGRSTRDQYVEKVSACYVRVFNDKNDSRKASYMAADMVLHAQKYGIQVLCVDTNNPLIRNHPELIAADREISEAVKRQAEKDADKLSIMSFEEQVAYGKELGKKYVEKNFSKERRQHLLELTLQERFSNDKDIATIIQQLSGQEKSAIFYGISHGDNFAKALGEENVAKIALCVDANKKTEWAAKGWETFDIKPEIETPKRSGQLRQESCRFVPGGP